MFHWKKTAAAVISLLMIAGATACGAVTNSSTATQIASMISAAIPTKGPDPASVEPETVLNPEPIDMTKWQYNAEGGVYYQIGIPYCATPVDPQNETLAIFVPEAYFTAQQNEDGTYTCALSEEACGGYTAQTAPIVMPVHTPGYAAMAALTDYAAGASVYTKEGFVYVHAGCRGRDAGAPAGVTDLKAAVRYLRSIDELCAGSAERIFTFGMSGGGAQSAVMGASGDSGLYDPYLAQIGAASGVSDAIFGAMCWCPITSLDTADASYEWMMGSTRSGLSEEEQEISDTLAAAWAFYVNAAGFTDENGNELKLEASPKGIDQAGSYYDYLKATIERSLDHFLEDTQFPYTVPSDGHRSGHADREGAPEQAPAGEAEKAAQDAPAGETEETAQNTSAGSLILSGTYETAKEYIAALNENGKWVIYDAKTNTAEIASIADFAAAFKPAAKKLGAFDSLEGGQPENLLFGCGDGIGAHFDATLADILFEVGSVYAGDYAADLQRADALGNGIAQRLQMYSPLYYLLASQGGCGTSTPAKHWRIRSGIAQSDTALTTELNLALALRANEAVESVDFETVWGQGHTEAERTGGSTENLIAWIHACMK